MLKEANFATITFKVEAATLLIILLNKMINNVAAKFYRVPTCVRSSITNLR